MKQLLLLCILSIFSVYVNAQDTWNQKASTVSRSSAVAFSIGNKGYMGTGDIGAANEYFADFWEYDPSTNVWTQKADFGGGARSGAVGFSIGSKGYIGTGGATDFWEYDTSTNQWTRKADFGGGARSFAVGFSIGNKGYIGTGQAPDFNQTPFKDFWEYDPSSDQWTQKADFGGGARRFAFGFGTSDKGYVGTGETGAIVNDFYETSKDFWEYDPSTDQWTQKADFGGGFRSSAACFSIESEGYVGLGSNPPVAYSPNDFWEYDPSSDTWSQKTNFPGTPRNNAIGFSIGPKGYFGAGTNATEFNFGYLNDVFEYSVSSVIASTLASNTYCMGSNSGIALNVPFTLVGTFNNKNTFTAQLSDSTGNFANAVNIGTTNGRSSGTIAAVIPFSTLPGYHYRVRVNASDPFCIGSDNGADIFIDNFTYYRDADGDGYGDINNKIKNVCPIPPGYVRDSSDCNDNDATVHTPQPYYVDADHDGYGSQTTAMVCSLTAPVGYSTNNTDCNDNDSGVHSPVIYFPDTDGDGYGYDMNKDPNNNCFRWVYNPGTRLIEVSFIGGGRGCVEPPAPALFCTSTPPPGWSANGDDCNDKDATVHPRTFYKDADGDGFGNPDSSAIICSSATPPAGYVTDSTDCNDNNAAINPTTVWYKDADNDGYSDGTTQIQCTRPTGYKLASELTGTSGDCNDNNAAINPATVWYKDADNDGYSDGTTQIQCTRPSGFKLSSELITISGDCNDNNAAINPATVWYKDADNDGYSDGTTQIQCTRPSGFKLPSELISTSGDCDDNNPAIYPTTVWYKDADNDGYGNGTSKLQCTRPTGYKLASELIATSGDCNDNDPTVHSFQTYYRDADGDGYGNPGVTTLVCSSTPPAGYVSNKLDCNDNDPAISPAAVEVCGNKVDDNCNGVVDEKTCYPCQNGTNLTTTNITSNSAQVNWTATANPQQWQLEYKTTATGSQWIDVFLTGNIRSAKLTSLKAKQSYNWHLRAKCNGSWTGYSNAISFTTLASGATVSSSTATTLNNPTLKLYPNPNKGNFLVELNVLDKINANATIQLIDMTGKTVQMDIARINNGTLQKTIHVSPALAEGLYMVRILVNDTVYKTQMIYAK